MRCHLPQRGRLWHFVKPDLFAKGPLLEGAGAEGGWRSRPHFKGYYYYKNERRFCQAKKGRLRNFNWNFCPEKGAGGKTGLDNSHVMGYKERERSAQGDSLPAKGEAGESCHGPRSVKMRN